MYYDFIRIVLYICCVLNEQKRLNIQNSCKKGVDRFDSRRYFLGRDCDCFSNVDDAGIRILLCRLG